jgi:hypothetical protein
MFKKPVIVAGLINIRVLVVEVGWRRRLWPSGLLSERARRELTVAVVQHFQRVSQPGALELGACRVKLFVMRAHLARSVRAANH